MSTEIQYDAAIKSCRDIFLTKTRDYGTSWRVYRTISVVDQIYIKAKRIRTIQEKGEQRVGDDIHSEFMGIVNYSIIGLIQLQLAQGETEELPLPQVAAQYDEKACNARKLMLDKNHDYGEAWREMSQESFTDLVLSKLMRIRQILANGGQSASSEGIDANYYDIINYAVFALILMQETSGKVF